MEEDITPTISAKQKIYTAKKTERSKASNKTVYTPKINKTDTVTSLYKSRFTQISNTKDTVDKYRSIPRSN